MSMQYDEEKGGVRARADIVGAIVLVCLGLLVFYFSYTMPRLEARGIHPTTIPGLVFMMLGAALAVLGVMLGVSAWKASAAGGSWSAFFRLFWTLEAARVVAAFALVLLYTLVFVGWLPFWAASMVFLFLFIVTMEIFLTAGEVSVLRAIFWAAATAIFAGGGIYYLFAQVFLVRLP